MKFSPLAVFLMLMVFAAGSDAAAVFQPVRPGVGFWQFVGVLLTPGALAVVLTILFVRYQRAFAQDDRKEAKASGETIKRKTSRYWFNYTLIWGAVFGVISQIGLQGAVNYLTGMPIMWELMVVAVGVTGLASMGIYELVRWYLAVKIKKGEGKWVPVYEWLSNKKITSGKPQEGDDMTVLSRFLDEDTTQPK